MGDREMMLASLPDESTTWVSRPQVEFCPISELWVEFESQLGLLGGRVVSADEWAQLLERPRWCDPVLGLTDTAESIWEAEVGVSLAIGAVAKSGTLIFEAGPDRLRLSSLIPPVNLVMVDRSAIVPTLHEAMARLSERTTVFATGPSRTADIEGVMVRGVHGPGQLLVHVRDA
jgi:L-lactate utilization protein LutC